MEEKSAYQEKYEAKLKEWKAKITQLEAERDAEDADATQELGGLSALQDEERAASLLLGGCLREPDVFRIFSVRVLRRTPSTFPSVPVKNAGPRQTGLGQEGVHRFLRRRSSWKVCREPSGWPLRERLRARPSSLPTCPHPDRFSSWP